MTRSTRRAIAKASPEFSEALADGRLDLRADVRSFCRLHRLGSVDRPGENECKGIHIALREDRVAELRPPITHQIRAFQQVGGMTQAKRVSDLVQGHPA